ncbi:glycogen debranching protein GlgX [Pseudoalteromonas luteoviolacea]|uniref:glycogen debranching protein GlgX n=1 Tax=Pseudoalteromonas luteoviolacea TaxID=43657 RepID=UPI001151693F|nr:glycogen debranching protein GlgX [Pseudoalteromonas luteoviolacea]TQF67434.1 glycogen debranching protein GlgX [Pseudoalteromonas luteoviolacea]
MLKTSIGCTYPLGNAVCEKGVNFAVYAPSAEQVILCLFDHQANTEIARMEMIKREGGLWTLFVESIGEGALYGYRVDGLYDPGEGFFFNKNKLLLDPYCKDFRGDFTWSERHYCHLPVGEFNSHDNAIDMPKSRVFTPKVYEGKKPDIAWHDSFIYECHVKGATQTLIGLSKEKQGTFSGICDSGFIEHLKSMGVTAIELLPVHAFISEQFLTTKGLQNYWGYNTLSFFVPHKAYCVNGNVTEFQKMVATLHEHNIEVIIDVVYNHTAESGIDGPMLSMKGLHNRGYYRMLHTPESVYINDTGCGNTINIDDPITLRLILDSLRYWVEYMGVDGFRFDLATILGRTNDGFHGQHAFFQAIAQDPILSQVKLIAEPWDVGPGGYQLGAFPPPWREWNDKYRDIVRRFWRGDSGTLPELAKRIHGSNDLFEHNLRGPLNSINFLTSHDGFSLADWVSYENKHNDANGEHNRDGHSENYSFNCGVEGETADPEIINRRNRLQTNALVTLFMSKGVPMICAGTELNHTQKGNNNAYCQDNENSWLNWHNLDSPQILKASITSLMKIRSKLSVFKHPFYVHTDDNRFAVLWYNSAGQIMSESDWHDELNKTLIYILADNEKRSAVLVILHADCDGAEIQLPESPFSTSWEVAYSSLDIDIEADQPLNSFRLTGQSAWVLLSHNEETANGSEKV